MEINITEHSDIMQRNKGTYQKFIEGIINIFKQCTNQKHHDYFSLSHKVSKVVPILCEETFKINYEYVQKKTVSIRSIILMPEFRVARV